MLPPAGAHLIGEWFPEPSSTNIITDHDGDHWDCGARAGKELTCTFNYYLIFDSSACIHCTVNEYKSTQKTYIQEHVNQGSCLN